MSLWRRWQGRCSGVRQWAHGQEANVPFCNKWGKRKCGLIHFSSSHVSCILPEVISKHATCAKRRVQRCLVQHPCCVYLQDKSLIPVHLLQCFVCTSPKAKALYVLVSLFFGISALLSDFICSDNIGIFACSYCL